MPSVNRDISFKERQQAAFETNELLEKILKALQHQNKLLEGLQPRATVDPGKLAQAKQETKDKAK